MKLIKRKAPGRLSRAIVTLAARTGNKLMRATNNSRVSGLPDAKESTPPAKKHGGQLQVSKRITITLETERLLVVRRELRRLRYSGAEK